MAKTDISLGLTYFEKSIEHGSLIASACAKNVYDACGFKKMSPHIEKLVSQTPSENGTSMHH
jgi:hypothetical protein